MSIINQNANKNQISLNAKYVNNQYIKSIIKYISINKSAKNKKIQTNTLDAIYVKMIFKQKIIIKTYPGSIIQ